MTSTKFGIVGLINSFPLFNFFVRKAKPHQTYDYTHELGNLNYVFEPIDGHDKGHMTGYGKGVKIDDRIILQDAGEIYTYQIEQIDYYLDPPDMWIALLKRVMEIERDI